MTRPYAEVIGDPIAHSKSPLIHNFWLNRLGIAAEYRSAHIVPEALGDYIASRSADPLWRGCNVTVPHKIAVLDHVPDPGQVKATIGAVNTVARQADGTLFVTNTDAAGFYSPIAALDLAGAAVTVIGNGGAAHAVLFALSRCDVGEVTLFARNPVKAAGLLARFALQGRVARLGIPAHDSALVVNCTTLGMTGQPALDLDLTELDQACVIYDLVYAPLETPLMAAARRRGLRTIGGLDMLTGQAAIAFELFFGVAPPADTDNELRDLLSK